MDLSVLCDAALIFVYLLLVFCHLLCVFYLTLCHSSLYLDLYDSKNIFIYTNEFIPRTTDCHHIGLYLSFHLDIIRIIPGFVPHLGEKLLH